MLSLSFPFPSPGSPSLYPLPLPLPLPKPSPGRGFRAPLHHCRNVVRDRRTTIVQTQAVAELLDVDYLISCFACCTCNGHNNGASSCRAELLDVDQLISCFACCICTGHYNGASSLSCRTKILVVVLSWTNSSASWIAALVLLVYMKMVPAAAGQSFWTRTNS